MKLSRYKLIIPICNSSVGLNNSPYVALTHTKERREEVKRPGGLLKHMKV